MGSRQSVKHERRISENWEVKERTICCVVLPVLTFFVNWKRMKK